MDDDRGTGLDAAMNERRLELRLRWAEVARRAGMSYPNLRRIRNGDISLTEFAATGIDQALKWPPGTAMAKHAGTADADAVKESADPVEIATRDLITLDGEELLRATEKWLRRLDRTDYMRALNEAMRVRAESIADGEAERDKQRGVG
jgi:hypothetical protein